MILAQPWKYQKYPLGFSQAEFSQEKLNFGGKGNGLCRLTGLGLPIPKTALFNLDEWDRWSEKNIRDYRLILDRCAQWRSPETAQELAQFRKNNLDVGFSEEALNCINSLRNDLGEGHWIVRSSMSFEDGDGSSFAGCFASIRLPAQTEAESVFRAMLSVWMSAFTESAMSRLLSYGVDPRKFRAGFLVQEYRTPLLGGVCFTRDPANLWKKSGLLEWGKGVEDVVQGTLTCNQMGLASESESPPDELAPFWSEVWRYSSLIEARLRGPSEWEWVWDGSQLWVVQARRIATPEADLVARTRPGGGWTRELAMERFPEPLTPMGWPVLYDILPSNLQSLDRRFGIIAKRPEDVAVQINGVVYSDPEFFKFPTGVRIRWSHYLLPWKVKGWKLLGLLARRLLRTVRATQERGKKVSRALAALETLDILLEDQAVEIEKGWDAHRDLSVLRIEKFTQELQKVDVWSDLEILSHMDALRKLSIEFLEPDLAIFLIKERYFKALLEIGVSLGRDELEVTQATRISSGNRTLEMNLEWKNFLETLDEEDIEAFSQFCQDLLKCKRKDEALRAGDSLRPAAVKAWRSFMAKNAHSRTSWDVAVPGWGSHAAQLVPLLKAFRNAKRTQSQRSWVTQKDVSASGMLPEKNRELFRQIETILAQLQLHSSLPLLEKCFKRVEAFMRIDEEQHFLAGLLLDPSRELLQRAGELLWKEGLLNQPEDVFFLKLEEMKTLLSSSPEHRFSVKLLSVRRKSEWKRACRSPCAHQLPRPSVPSKAKSVEERDLRLLTALQGLPVSQGQAIGIVHKVEHLIDADGIPPGAILVTTSPNPTLTPVFPLLAGLVSVTGGPLSHGFVAAREYSLPAVSGIENAMDVLRTGMKVRIDGTAGTLEILT